MQNDLALCGLAGCLGPAEHSAEPCKPLATYIIYLPLPAQLLKDHMQQTGARLSRVKHEGWSTGQWFPSKKVHAAYWREVYGRVKHKKAST